MTAVLDEIIADFQAVGTQERLAMLVEFSKELPALPAGLDTSAMESVPECQSPLFVYVDAADTSAVRVHLYAPPEAPTTRGFAAILAEALDGQPAETILALEGDLARELGLEQALSTLRTRGVAAMIYRIKRQLRLALGAE